MRKEIIKYINKNLTKFQSLAYEKYLKMFLALSEKECTTQNIQWFFDKILTVDPDNLYSKLQINIQTDESGGSLKPTKCGYTINLNNMEKHHNTKLRLRQLLYVYLHEKQHAKQFENFNNSSELNTLFKAELIAFSQQKDWKYDFMPSELDANYNAISEFFMLVSNKVVPFDFETALLLKSECLNLMCRYMGISNSKSFDANLNVQNNPNTLINLYKFNISQIDLKHYPEVSKNLDFDKIKLKYEQQFKIINQIYEIATYEFLNIVNKTPKLKNYIFDNNSDVRLIVENFYNISFNKSMDAYCFMGSFNNNTEMRNNNEKEK